MPRDRPRPRDPWEIEITRNWGKRETQREHHRENPRLKGREKEMNIQKLTISLSISPAQTLPSLGSGSGQYPPPAASPGPPALQLTSSWQGRERTPLLSEVLGSPRLALQCSGPCRGHLKVTGESGRKGLACGFQSQTAGLDPGPPPAERVLLQLYPPSPRFSTTQPRNLGIPNWPKVSPQVHNTMDKISVLSPPTCGRFLSPSLASTPRAIRAPTPLHCKMQGAAGGAQHPRGAHREGFLPALPLGDPPHKLPR